MADDNPAPETTEPATRRRKSPPPVQAPAATKPEPAPAPTPDMVEARLSGCESVLSAEWLRYNGQVRTVFADLGGEIEPGQVVRPRTQQLTELLLTRDDFEPAEAPTTDAEPGTAH